MHQVHSIALSGLFSVVLGSVGCASTGGAPAAQSAAEPVEARGVSAPVVSAAEPAAKLRVDLKSTASPMTIAQPALYPETLEVNQQTGKFLVSSVREGAVYEVGLDGTHRKVIEDDHLTSILGIAVDPRTNRLVVTNSDLGASIKHSQRGAKKEAGVGIYDLASGRALHYVDLIPLFPEGDHLINGITVDAEGNAYVTDSFSPVIYKVDPQGVASVFLQSDEFKGQGINLNGIVYHPKGFLLVVKKSSGVLYRIPLTDPQHFSKVDVSTKFDGGDGLLLVGEDNLVLVANQTPGAVSNSAFALKTHDGWSSGEVVESRPLGNVYPTTCAALNGKVYVLSSHLNEWIGATEATRDGIAKQARHAEILEIGSVGQ
jgi:DNA-binding beta-propeller fold protein YncE